MASDNQAAHTSLDQRCPMPQSSFSELQLWMTEALRHGHALSRDAELAGVAARHVSGNDRLSPAEQLEIYREQFWLRHTRTLIDDYPGLKSILPPSEWKRVAESYLSSRKPDGFSLRDLGRSLADHLEGLAYLPHQRLCVDMARLERAYAEAFVAGDSPGLNAASLRKLSPEQWETARFVVSPSLRLLRLDYPVAALRRSLRRTSATQTPPDLDLPSPAPHRLVVYRRDTNLYDKVVSETAFELLAAFTDSLPLVPACQRVLDLVPEASESLASRLEEWFSLWGRLGWIVGVEADEGKRV